MSQLQEVAADLSTASGGAPLAGSAGMSLFTLPVARKGSYATPKSKTPAMSNILYRPGAHR